MRTSGNERKHLPLGGRRQKSFEKDGSVVAPEKKSSWIMKEKRRWCNPSIRKETRVEEQNSSSAGGW